jgi:hypothetical protein
MAERTGKRTPPRKRTAAKKATSAKPLAEVTPLPTSELEPRLLDVLNAAVKQMTWLAESDEAMVELAREYCRRIDAARDQAEEWDAIAAPLREMAEITESKSLIARLIAVEKALDVTKQVGWIGPHLANALRDLGGAPGERKGLVGDGNPVESKLQQIRSAAAKRRPPRAR